MNIFSQRRFINYLFLLLFLVLVGNYVFLYYLQQQTSHSRRWVYHTYEVLNAVSQTQTLFNRSGYLVNQIIHGDKQAAITYDINKKIVYANVITIKNLVSDNSSQEANLDNLKSLIDRKFKLLDQIILLANKNDKNEAIFALVGSSNAELIKQTIKQFDTINNAEQRLLAFRAKFNNTYFNHTDLALKISIIFSSIILLIGLTYLNLLLIKNQRSEESQKQIEEDKNEFVSMVSHELRTPVTSIQGSITLLKTFLEPEKNYDQILEIANNNCERLNLLINDILDFDKMSAGKMDFDLKNHEAFYLIDKAIILNLPYAEKFGIGIIKENFITNVFIHVDENRLIQVFTNLLSNAVKFAKPKTTIRVAMEHKDQHTIIFAITNEGKGISKEFSTHVFKRFAQAGQKVTGTVKGTGLGLAISKTIIELLHGKIYFSSIEGQETTFYVSLPIIQTKEIT